MTNQTTLPYEDTGTGDQFRSEGVQNAFIHDSSKVYLNR